MSAISLKSITGITSITTPAGVDNQLTLHTNDTTERVKIDIAGNVHVNNHLAITGVTTTTDNINIDADNKKLQIGDSQDLELFHNGTNSVINNTEGALLFQNNGSSSMYIASDGQVSLNNDITFIGASANALWDKSENYFSIPDKIVHSGDTNTSIRFPANDTITAETSGTERLRIESGGDIGIGTDNPHKRLHVADYGTHGAIRVEGSGNGNRSGIEFYRETSAGVSKGGAAIWVESDTSSSAGKLRFGTASNASVQSQTTDMILDHNGNVGIGTDNPQKTLNVFADVGTTELIRLSQPVDASTQQEFGIGWCSNNNHTHPGAQITSLEYDVSDPRRDLLFYTRGVNSDSAPTERLRITSDGRLLMGVTTSQQGDANLQVFRAATTSRITFGNENVSASGVAGIDFCPSNKVQGSRIECQAQEDFSTSANRTADLVFFTRHDGTSSEKVRITSDGKFGFGTNSPDQTVHIHKGSAGSIDSTATSVLTLENSTTAVLQFLTPNNVSAQLRFGDPQDNGAGFIDYSHNANTMSFGVYGPTRMQIDSNGHLGINVASVTQLANSKRLTLRPTDDDGIRLIRPGDGNNSPSVHLDLTTTTSGSTLRSGGEAYTTKYHGYNNDLLFRSYEDGGTGGIIRFVTSDGSGGTQNFWQIDEKGMTTHRSRSSTVKTHEFTYTGGAGGGTLNVNLLSISGYSSNATCVVKTEYVGMYGLANSYISQGIWLCSYRRANGGSAANALAQQTHNGSNSSSSNVTIAWVGDNLRLTVGAYTGFTVHVTATVYNATINVLV